MTDIPLLIVGGASDPNTMRIVQQAEARGCKFLFWNTDLPNATRIAWDFETPQIDLGEQSITPGAVFFRYNVFDGDPEANLAVFDLIQSYVLAWPEIRVLNRATMTDANNKSKNLRLAKEIGFSIPDTIVMGDMTPLANIPAPERRAIKPLGGGAHTKSVSQVYRDLDALAAMGPQFVQSKLEGENLRVFSINDQACCFHLKTTQLDYRDDPKVEVHQIEMPKHLNRPTSHLVHRLRFDYCALDFRCRNGMDEPVFLEVNSFPMFVRFDDAGQNCLANAMLDFLARS